MNQAHRIEPEPRWRWLVGVAGEIGFLGLCVVFVLVMAGAAK